MKKIVFRFFCLVICSLFVAELFFRVVLPASEWPRGVILDSGVRRFDGESFTAGRFTYGRYCNGGFQWRINLQGWNSIYEYQVSEERRKPMFAMLGDSYLEGFYSDVDEHIDVFLTNLLQDTTCFYSFAMSGGILSQYIALMRYEVEQYNPDGYILFVNSSDVSRSFRETGGRHPYYFQYQRDDSGSLSEVKPMAESRSKIKDAVLLSAFVRYLRANAQMTLWGGGLADENADIAAAPTDSVFDEGISEEMFVAADFILQELDSFGRPVLIVADCPKDWIYEGTEEEAYDDVIALRELVSGYGNVSMLELADYYPEEYSRSGRLFSHSDNAHWDAYANEFIARTLAPVVAEMLLTEGSFE